MSASAWAAPSCSSFLRLPSESFTLSPDADDTQIIDAYYKGVSVGFINFDYDSFDKNLSVYAIKINSDFRRNSLSKILLEEVLKQHPETLTIESALTQVNKQIYMDKIKEIVSDRKDEKPTEADVLEAVMHTPAYLIRASLGFSKIIKHQRDANGTVTLHVSRPTRN